MIKTRNWNQDQKNITIRILDILGKKHEPEEWLGSQQGGIDHSVSEARLKENLGKGELEVIEWHWLYFNSLKK